MFTGIVECRGRIAHFERKEGRVDLAVDMSPYLTEDVAIGDSIALDGLCLTVTAIDGARLSFQAIPETLEKTALADFGVGDGLNVERALRAGDRLGGHIVQGHVDGTGVVREVRRDGEDVRMRVDCSEEIAALLVPKGSVTVAGVSLTVVEPDPGGFSVALIPHTLAETTLGERVVGERVNLEVDVLGKYVYQYLNNRVGTESPGEIDLRAGGGHTKGHSKIER